MTHDSKQHKEHGTHHSHPSHNVHHVHQSHSKDRFEGSNFLFLLVIVVALVMAYNQFQIFNAQSSLALVTGAVSSGSISSGIDTAEGPGGSQGASVSGGKDLSGVDINSLKSTAHSVAALFDVESIQTQQDAINVMIPTGTPDYGPSMGVSYDSPVESLALMASSYEALKAEAKKSDPESWQRFLNLATKPVGISCEYCCGVGPVGIDPQGNLRCGCQHNPAVLTLALWLMQNTDYSDAQVLKEVLTWKTLFFPKNMVEIAMTVAGGDTSKLEDLPGMVGGC
ncbi:MAG: hypothetical protein ACE5DI_03810 [Candidatus Micrarchaeia archaeon]